MITKEHFLKCLNIISNQYNMAEELNKIFHTYEKSDFLDGYGFINNEIINLLVETLDKSFNENCDWVHYYIFEIDSGWYEGTVIDEKGNAIDISTPENLYDFLCKEYNK